VSNKDPSRFTPDGLRNETTRLYLELRRLYQAGEYSRAIPIALQLQHFLEDGLDPERPLVAGTIDGLSELFQKSDANNDAELLYKRALDIYEEVLGPDHSDIAVSIRDLAILCISEGKYAEAEVLYERGAGPC
jgi:hypothetical protein